MTHQLSRDVLFCLEFVLAGCISHIIHLYTANVASTGDLIMSFSALTLNIFLCYSQTS